MSTPLTSGRWLFHSEGWKRFPDTDIGYVRTRQETEWGYESVLFICFLDRATGQFEAVPIQGQDVISTAGTGTYTSKASWNNARNLIEVVGAGAAGAFGASTSTGGGGGAGGNYNSISNFTFATPGTTTASYGVGAPGLHGGTFPQNGGDTWFNSVAYPTTGTAVGAKGGNSPATNTTATGGTAGALTANYPTSTGSKGGDAGSGASATAGGGGGGAGGPHGAGGSASGTTGGTGDGGNVAAGAAGNPGTSFIGTTWPWATPKGVGSGAGGSNASGGTGGTATGFGGGGGGGSRSTGVGGDGFKGVIVLTWDMGGGNDVLELPPPGLTARNFPTSLRTWQQSPPNAPAIVYVPSRVTNWMQPSNLIPPPLLQWWTNAPPPVVVDTTKIPARVTDWGMWNDPRVAMSWTQAPFQGTPVGTGNIRVTQVGKEVWSSDTGTNVRVTQVGKEVWTTDTNTTIRVTQIGKEVWFTPSIGSPTNQFDWPLPQRAVRAVQTWTQGPPPPVTVVAQKPVNQFDWPLPSRAIQAAPSWTQRPPPPPPVVLPKPVNQTNWPLPIQRAQPPRTWTQSPIFATTVTPPTLIPSRVTDWGEMWQQPRKALTFVRGVAGVAGPTPAFMPSRITDWGEMWQKPRMALTFVRGVAGVTTAPPTFMPSRVKDWGEMWQTPRRALTFVRGPAGVGLPPCNQADWPLPRPQPPFFPAPLPTTIALRTTALSKPVNQADWPLPIRIVVPVQTWTQDQLPLLTQTPVVKVDWQLPARQLPFTPAPISTTVGLRIASVPKPVNQADWPLPIRAVQPAQTWTQEQLPLVPFVPGPKPVNQADWQLPQQPALLVRTWIDNPVTLRYPTPVGNIRVTQVGKEVWTSDVSTNIRVTQVGKEVWTRDTTTNVRVTQVGKEIWYSMGAPLPFQAPTAITIPLARQAVTWTQGPPLTSMLSRPCNQSDWPVPVRPTPFTPAPLPITVGLRVASIPKPVNQYDWPLPLRASSFVPASFPIAVGLRIATSPFPANQDDWPVPIAAQRMANYGYTFSPYTGRMSPPDMPPRIGVFSPPIGYQYPADLRTFAQAPFHGVGPSATSTGMLHGIPFIATMGAMTAR